MIPPSPITLGGQFLPPLQRRRCGGRGPSFQVLLLDQVSGQDSGASLQPCSAQCQRPVPAGSSPPRGTSPPSTAPLTHFPRLPRRWLGSSPPRPRRQCPRSPDPTLPDQPARRGHSRCVQPRALGPSSRPSSISQAFSGAGAALLPSDEGTVLLPWRLLLPPPPLCNSSREATEAPYPSSQGATTGLQAVLLLPGPRLTILWVHLPFPRWPTPHSSPWCPVWLPSPPGLSAADGPLPAGALTRDEACPPGGP